MALEVGTLLGRYRIVALLGAGGMAEVYRARDAHLDRDVAIKVLSIAVTADASAIERFLREARAVAALEHPGILAIHDFGVVEAGGEIAGENVGPNLAWAAMELLHGQSLRERLRGGPIPLRKSIELARQLADALAAAHEQGILHRDVKPENIFVTDAGQVKVLDFGLTGERNFAPDASDDTSATTYSHLTKPGTVMGTVGYMSPEQVRGESVDHRSDVFSFGCVLYEMLTGRRAFLRATSAETMTAVLREEPLHLADSGIGSVPQTLDRLLWHCLEKNPAERFHSASDLAFALGNLSSAASTGTAAVAGEDSAAGPRSRSDVVRWSLAAALLVTAFALGRFTASDTAETSLRGKLEQLTFESPGGQQPSISPAGDSVVYTRNDVGTSGDTIRNLYLHRIGGEHPIALTPDSATDDSQPAFSPNGQRIAFRSERDGGGVFIMGATGESGRRLADFGYNPTWSPDGREIVVASESIDDPFDRQMVSELWRLDVATGERARITEGDAVQPHWSPNGKFLVFWSLPAGTARRAIQSMPATGGRHRVLVDDGFINWTPRWAGDGRSIVFASDRDGVMNLWRLAVDPETGEAVGEPAPITKGERPVGSVSVARDGVLAYALNQREYAIHRAPFDLATLRWGTVATVLRTSRPTSLEDVSDSGDRLLSRIDDGDEDLMLMNADGTGRLRLTHDSFRDRNAELDPSGRYVYFDSTRSGTYASWRVDTDGSDLTPVFSGDDKMYSPAVSPDGRWLAGYDVPRKQAGLLDLQTAVEARTIRWIPRSEGRGLIYGEWSKDGRELIGFDVDGRGFGIYSLDTDQVEWVRNRGSAPTFLADGRVLFLEDRAAHVLDRTTGEVLTLPEGVATGESYPEFRFFPRGEDVWFNSRTTSHEIWILHPE